MTDNPGPEAGDPRQKSDISPAATMNTSDAGQATEEWQAAYFSVDQRGALAEQRVPVHVPGGLARVCPPVPIGAAGCVYGVRRWGFILRPSALEAAGLDPTSLSSEGDDVSIVGAMLRAATYELPGEYIIASPEHPFRLLAHDGILRGGSTRWRTYLGALAFFASCGETDAPFIRFWAEAEDSYRVAVDHCLMSLKAAPCP